MYRNPLILWQPQHCCSRLHFCCSAGQPPTHKSCMPTCLELCRWDVCHASMDKCTKHVRSVHMTVTRRVHFDSICIGFAPMCWHASPAADMHTRTRSCRESVHASVSQSTLDSISIKPWRNNKGTAVGAFDLWERAKTGRMSDIDAGGEQASIGIG